MLFRSSSYWIPLDSVITFKRGVYEAALSELARLLFVSPEEQIRLLMAQFSEVGGER